MKQANTLEARKVLHKAVKEAGSFVQQTWTDPVNWGDPDGNVRVVTFRVADAERIAIVANKAMATAGYSNKVRGTGVNDEYLRVNATRSQS
jgi:hypothetical protein